MTFSMRSRALEPLSPQLREFSLACLVLYNSLVQRYKQERVHRNRQKLHLRARVMILTVDEFCGVTRSLNA